MKAFKYYVVAGLLTAAINTPATAGTVTFGFEAEIVDVSVSSGGSQNIPSAMVGDSLTVVFSFNHPSMGFNNPQNLPISILLGGSEYVVPSFSITVRDQANRPIPQAGAIANPSSVSEVDQPNGAVSDSIWIGSISGSSGDFDTAIIGSNGLVEWNASILFAGSQSILSQMTVPANVSIWESMEFRELAIDFSDIGTANATRIGANIESVFVVPEPSAWLLLAIIVACCAIMFPRQSKRLCSPLYDV